MTDDILSSAQEVFETLLNCIDSDLEYIEFRIYPIERRAEKVPVLAFAIMDEEGKTGRIIPLAELISDSTKEQKQIFAFPHGALYATLQPEKEDTCQQKNSELSPSSFLIKSNEKKH